MKNWKFDRDRENEALWGDKEGFEGFLKRQKADSQKPLRKES